MASQSEAILLTSTTRLQQLLDSLSTGSNKHHLAATAQADTMIAQEPTCLHLKFRTIATIVKDTGIACDHQAVAAQALCVTQQEVCSIDFATIHLKQHCLWGLHLSSCNTHTACTEYLSNLCHIVLLPAKRAIMRSKSPSSVAHAGWLGAASC